MYIRSNENNLLILHEDNHIIIINKRCGDIVQGDKTGDTPLLDYVKKYIKIKLVSSEIMNQLSYHVDDKKIKDYGLRLNADLQKDVDDTLKLFSYLKWINVKLQQKI